MTTGTVQDKAISTAAVWSYGVGDDDSSIGDSSADFSDRFIPVPQHQASRSSSNMAMDDDHTLPKEMDQEQDASQELFSMPSAHPTSRRGSTSDSIPNMGPRGSLELTPVNSVQQSMDLNQSVHSFACEEESQDVIIMVKETGGDDHLDIELLVEATPSGTRERKKSTYSESWNELQLTPKNLLSKLMPHKVKEAQVLIAAKKQASSTPRAELYKKSRSELRSTLRKSFIRLDSFSADSNHTASTALLSDSFHCSDQASTSKDRKKWGVNSLLEDLQEGTKKKKTKKSKSSSSKRRSKSRTKREKGSMPKRSYSCPTVAKLEKKDAKKKKVTSGTSSVRSKESRKSKREENRELVPNRSSSCPNSDNLNKEERKKKKKSSSSRTRKSSSRKRSASKTCKSTPKLAVRAVADA